MWTRLPLLVASLVLAACVEPTTSIASSGETPTEAVAQAPEGTPDADTSAPDPAATPTANRPADEDDGDTSIPMVEVHVDASVEHATSGARTLTLRSGPSTSSENLGTFSYGTVLECQDRPRDDAWCWIHAHTDQEMMGWAKRRHLSYVGNIMEEAGGVRMFGDPSVWGMADGFPVDARWDILADDGYANVRATPGADGALVRRLDNRTMTAVERCDGGAPGRRWCEISEPVAGWVHQSGFHRQLRSL